jgi:ATP-dependent exoDNAse (exonuclease V) beta subunit
LNISNISVSRKSVWDTCQQQYKYKYHLKIPSPVEEPFYFTYGKLVHKIAEEYVHGKGDKNIQEVTTSVLKGEVPLDERDGKKVFAPKLPNDYAKSLMEHVRNVEWLTGQVGFEGLTEYKFSYDLEPPKGKIVLGFIDRLIEKDGNYFILDYKTTKKFGRKNRSNIQFDLQLRTYARVVQREFRVPAKNIKAALYYLDGGDLIATGFTEESLISAERELLKVYDDIKGTDENQAWGNVGSWCQRCDYRKMCPFYKVT